MRTAIRVLVCTALSACLMSSVQAQAVRTDLSAFTAVQVCVPFNVLIQPGSGYSISLDADQSVKNALRAGVVSGTLRIQTQGDFSTRQPIKLTVTLPAEQLQSVQVSSPSTVVVRQGFRPNTFAGSHASSGGLYVFDINTPSATLNAGGTGNIIAQGSIGSASVFVSGTGSVYVDGITGNVQVGLQGIGNAYINPAPSAGQISISGTASGLGRIYYAGSNVQCSVSSFGASFGQLPSFFPVQVQPFPYGGACQQSDLSIPQPRPTWTCGLEVTGTFDCTSTGSSSSASTSTSGGGQAFSSSSTSGNGVTQTSTSSNGVGGTSTFSTGTGTARSVECAVSGATLNML